VSAFGEETADKIMAAVRSSMGVTKGAAVPADLQLADMLVRTLCKTFGEFYDYVSETTEHTSSVLRAIAEPIPRYGWVPFHPGEWDANRLVPKVPVQEMNGASNE
jgi:hypothetical protein